MYRNMFPNRALKEYVGDVVNDIWDKYYGNDAATSTIT